MNHEESIVEAMVQEISRMADGAIRVHLDLDEDSRALAIRLFSERGCPIAIQPPKGLAISGVAQRLRLKKGPPRLVIDLLATSDEEEMEAIEALDQAQIYIARLKDHAQSYGAQATALKLSSFFRTTSVWKAIGTDADYMDWCRAQPCAICGLSPPSEPAHVRRINLGAGMSLKNTYGTIPLCRKHHGLQHAAAESAIAPQEEFDRLLIQHLERWAWAKTKEQLGYTSFRYVPPEALWNWAEARGVSSYLPHEYQPWIT